MKFRIKKERKLLSAKFWMAVLIIMIMVLSTAGFFIGSSQGSRSLSYNKYGFKKEANGYYVNVNGKYLRFDFFPGEINDTEADSTAISAVKNTKMIYMTSNFTGKNAQGIEQIKFELSNRFGKEFGIYTASGFTENTTYNTLTITCANATLFTPVIDFEEGNSTGIHSQAGCVILEGETITDFIKLKDRLLYGLYGIME